VKLRKVILGVAVVVCTGALAFGGEGGAQQGGQAGQRRGGRQGRGGQGGIRMPNLFGNRAGGVTRQFLAERLMGRFSKEEVPEELKQWAAETRLIQLRVRVLERQIEKKEEELLESKELAPLLAAYDKACAEYRAAMEKNGEIKKRREQIAEISKSLEQALSGAGAGEDMRQRYQNMRGQMDERRTLEEEIVSIIEKDAAVQGFSQVKMKAAMAFMDEYDAAKEKDIALAAMEKDKKQLEETLQEVERAVNQYGREKGLIGGGRRRGQATTPAPAGGEKKAPAAEGAKKGEKASETSF